MGATGKCSFGCSGRTSSSFVHIFNFPIEVMLISETLCIAKTYIICLCDFLSILNIVLCSLSSDAANSRGVLFFSVSVRFLFESPWEMGGR